MVKEVKGKISLRIKKGRRRQWLIREELWQRKRSTHRSCRYTLVVRWYCFMLEYGKLKCWYIYYVDILLCHKNDKICRNKQHRGAYTA
jgi:hypothetical protein